MNSRAVSSDDDTKIERASKQASQQASKPEARRWYKGLQHKTRTNPNAPTDLTCGTYETSMTTTTSKQGTLTDRGAGPSGSERAAEDKRRHTAETERHNTFKDFQGKLEKETEKASYERGAASIDRVIWPGLVIRGIAQMAGVVPLGVM